MPIEWVIGIILGCLGGLLGLYIKHLLDCNARERQRASDNAALAQALAVIHEQLASIRRDIGTHETGIIGQLHRYSKAITILNARFSVKEPTRDSD